MKNIEWNLLTPSQIEVRAQFQKKDDSSKMILLLFQDARCAMDAFDRQFGQYGWKCDYKAVGDKIYGCVAVWDDDKKCWIEKWDTGEESNISADKGQSSDILKRVAVRWGFARELYSAPRIVVDNDGYNCSGYKVSKVEYDENRKIKALEIVNRFGKVMYSYGYEKTENKPVSVPNEPKSNLDILREFCSNQIKIEPEWKEDIFEFGKFYKNIFEKKGWKGEFQVNKLYQGWVLNRKKKAA